MTGYIIEFTSVHILKWKMWSKWKDNPNQENRQSTPVAKGLKYRTGDFESENYATVAKPMCFKCLVTLAAFFH